MLLHHRGIKCRQFEDQLFFDRSDHIVRKRCGHIILQRFFAVIPKISGVKLGQGF
ncbi:hypothetical protein D3C81_2094810 [compost metagenome]